MKERIKNISFPAFLLLIVSLAQSKDFFRIISGAFRGYLSIGMILSSVQQLCPFVLFYFLFMKENEKKPLGIVAVLGGCITLVNGLFSARYLLGGTAFIDALVGGALYNLVSPVLIGILLMMLGSKLVKNKSFTKKYYVFCGFSIFLIAYASVFMAVANPRAIMLKLPTLLYALSLWYIPKLYVEQEYRKTRINTAKFIAVAATVVAMYLILGAAGGSTSGSSKSNSGEPWKDLGVSKKEYMEVYNYFKYGEHS